MGSVKEPLLTVDPGPVWHIRYDGRREKAVNTIVTLMVLRPSTSEGFPGARSVSMLHVWMAVAIVWAPVIWRGIMHYKIHSLSLRPIHPSLWIANAKLDIVEKWHSIAYGCKLEYRSQKVHQRRDMNKRDPSGSRVPIEDDSERDVCRIVEGAKEGALSPSNEAALGCSNGGSVSEATTCRESNLESQDALTYPDGGFLALPVVLDSFSAMVACFGMMNSIGTFQAYNSSHQLSHLTPGTVGWIFSLYVVLAFFCSAQVGPFFNARGSRVLVFLGSTLLILSMILLSNCTGEEEPTR